MQLSRAERRVAALEYEIAHLKRVASVDSLISRIRGRLQGKEPTHPVMHTPSYFVRPTKGYQLPHLGIWKRWLASRQGFFTLNGVVKVLCICCGIPIDMSSGDRTYVGTNGKKTVNGASLSKVTIGAVVKWNEEEVTVWNAYSETLPTEIDIEEKKVIRVVTHRALGCIACQSHMLKVESEAERSYQRVLSTYYAKMTEYRLTVEQYRKSVTRYSSPNFVVYSSLPNTTLLRTIQTESPRQPTPYILVDPWTVTTEQTVSYWKEQC